MMIFALVNGGIVNRGPTFCGLYTRFGSIDFIAFHLRLSGLADEQIFVSKLLTLSTAICSGCFRPKVDVGILDI